MRISLARRTLLHDWRRFAAAIAALALSGMLMLVQLGLMYGMFDTFTVVMRKAHADLWVTSPDVESFELSLDVPARFEGRFWAHPDVLDVAPLGQTQGVWRRGAIKQVAQIIEVPTRADSAASLDGFTPDLLAALREPGAVVLDRVDAGKLGARAGEFAEINSHRVHVVGTVEGYRAAFGAYVFASHATMRFLGADEWANPYYLLRLRDPARAQIVREQLRPRDASAPYTVWLPADLAHQSQLYWLLDSGSGVSFGFSVVIALLVGLGVTSQTLRGAVLGQLRELAALRALGIGVARLRGLVVEQAAWVGVAGVGVMLVLTAALWSLAHIVHVALSFPIWTVIGAILFVIFIALGSSVASMGVLYRTQPAELLR
jgi:putative ABC transport system permease protein